jgi:hypothetical protein
MKSQFLTLKAWAAQQYGDDAPSIATLRRWCQQAKIFPAPKKHGRTYFVRQDAQYVDDYNDRDFLRRLRG